MFSRLFRPTLLSFSFLYLSRFHTGPFRLSEPFISPGEEKAAFDSEVTESNSPMSTLFEESPYKIFSGSSSKDLAREVATHLDLSLGRIMIEETKSTEKYIQILDSVRNSHVYVIQSLSPPINENISELLLMISTLKRSSAAKVTAVLPYIAYMRHTEYGFAKRKSIAIADLARMLETVGCDDIITVNLHIPETKGFFTIPVTNIDVTELGALYFARKLAKNTKDSVMIVSPEGKRNYISRAIDLQTKLEEKGVESSFTCLIKKENLEGNKLAYKNIGNVVEGKDCIIVDSIIEGGKTMEGCVRELRDQGARRIFMFVTHGILTKECLKQLDNILIDEIVTTNTIGEHGKMHEKVKYLSVGKLLAEAICHMESSKKLGDKNNKNK